MVILHVDATKSKMLIESTGSSLGIEASSEFVGPNTIDSWILIGKTESENPPP